MTSSYYKLYYVVEKVTAVNCYFKPSCLFWNKLLLNYVYMIYYFEEQVLLY